MDDNKLKEILEILKNGCETTISDISIQTGLNTKTIIDCLQELRRQGKVISLSNVASGVFVVQLTNC